jgi:ribosomal protein S10
MSARDPIPLHPTEVIYKGHKIVLTHRTKTNDWQYSFTHTRTITLSDKAPRYEAALTQAKKDIDVLLGDK